MSLRKIWTTQYQRFGRAAYAESNDVYIDVTVAEIISLMAFPTSRFYKVEIKENGAYVGYFIMKDEAVVKYFIRPHFSDLSSEFMNLIGEVQANASFSATIGSDNLKKS
jgi:hypothetical protein